MIYTIKKKKESTNIPLKFNISIPKALGEPFRERNFYSPWIFYRFLFKILFKKKKTEKEKKIKGFSRDSDQKYFINSHVLRHFKGVIKLPPTVGLIRDTFVLRSLAKKAAGFRVSNIWERSKSSRGGVCKWRARQYIKAGSEWVLCYFCHTRISINLERERASVTGKYVFP